MNYFDRKYGGVIQSLALICGNIVFIIIGGGCSKWRRRNTGDM
jgi:hypothetical protein